MRTPAEELADLEAAHLRRTLRPVAARDGGKLEREGRPLVPFASNDYLGLADSDFLRDAFQEAAGQFGAGSGASRLITGSRGPHHQLEETLADFKGTERALTFSSGYATAVGIITSVVGKGDIIILDKLCHASLIDGARLSEATLRVFPHNHLEKLESLLLWAREKVAAKGRILIITETVFSMDGDRAELEAICALKERHGALLLVDEAHATGVVGPAGRGLADELGLSDALDLQMGTLSKAIGVSGGFVCASADWIELLVNRARSFIYSTAPPPAIAETAQHSVELIRSGEGDILRQRLWSNLALLQSELALPSAPQSAVIPWTVGESEAALRIAQQLEESGYLVPAIRFPTVPRGTARLRISVIATHSRESICGLGESLRRIAGPETSQEEASQD